ncbi:cyclic pyranopterin monophosphate synthase MoaC [Thermomicrobium sp. CFH 73360]|uniref:cyclic pyranopterin monophosphate synthase MoaC n=1 Tax=Thermomicrobium sp. CFH 73360 TaxID=2951987 RepID=UPI002076A5FA|nr:cyclic pyranopterin monophosphate synthase MoaC [Thermomicrobium sp. CFH 73360]MCM8744962.1 cyclic pyranopterin monophosphate synthase MoaC [Thermomicrobium sp. CFH 73360]
MTELTHFDERGQARMVDVSAKPETQRVAVARGRVQVQPGTLRVVREGRAAKGDVLGVARVAGIMAAKRTADLIPLCHPIPLTKVELDLQPNEAESCIEIEARVETVGRTGVEMEALTAVAVAALTVYDMLKAIDRGITIDAIGLVLKAGGRSGEWRRSG